jgi:adenine-specific DNA-methyltransferase
MAKGIRYGLDNPHPLSKLKTELVWEGKYDEYGNRRTVDVAGCAMPLQKIETIDEPASRLRAKDDLFDVTKAHRDDFRNMLIWGDNKLVMASLLKDFKGKVDLVYIDPPFDVGADFTMNVPIGDEKETAFKDQSTLEMVAYRDMWGKGTDSYVHTMYERLTLMKELLSTRGSIFVHLAPTVSHHVRCVLDDVFLSDNFRNEIIVNRPISKNLQRQFDTIAALPQGHDSLLWYSARPATRYKNLVVPYQGPHAEGYWHRFWSGADRPTMRYELLGVKLKNGQWKWERERALRAVANYTRFLAEGKGRTLAEYWRDTGCELEFIRRSKTETVENWFPPSEDKIGDTVWGDIKAYENVKEFPTQKHVELLTRVIEFGSEPNDLIADLFCGGGTTGAVAERQGRRWIMCDLGRFAIHTSRKRMIGLQRKLHEEGKPYRAFDVYNLGRYERQWWQKERLRGADEEHRKVVLGFYKAEMLPQPIGPLHGRKGRAFVHVDAIDGMLTRDEVRAVAKAAHEAGAKEVHCLAWEFEMDLRLVCNELEATEGVTIRLIPIPREIMEKNRTSPPPFLEVAVLEAEPVYKTEGKKRVVDIKLKRFMPSLAEVPTKELEALKERAVKSGFDFIDFWAVDFNYHDDKPFEHHWQDYRTRKDRSLKTVSDAAYDKYPKPGVYTACVKVVDVFGCDTSITVKVDTRG